MGKYTSYYLYQKYEKIGSQDWTPVYPQTLSVYSDGTESGSTVIKTDNDIACGYKPSTIVQYRWVILNPSTDYICDDCQLWVASGYICDNGDLYEQLNEQNFDGKNWYYTGTKKKGKLIEKDSKNCTGDTGTTTGSTTGSMKVTYTDGTTKYFTGLTSIEEDTDSNKVNAKSVEIYDGVKIIGKHAFDGCNKLTDIVIPNSVTSIGAFAFDNCKSLTVITIPDSVTSIGNWAFWGCEKLVSATLPNGITIIPWCAFHHCHNLTGITIPNSVTSIDNYAFADCKSLTGITIPNSVTSIGQGAFEECSKLTEMTVKATTPPSLDHYAFADSGIQTIYVPADSVDAYKAAWDDYGNSYADKILPIGASMKVTYTDGSTKYFTGLTTIDENTDSNKSNAKSVEIYDSVTRIGYRAFANCSSLTSITISNSVTYIDVSTFNSCSGLTSIIIPESVTSIDNGAFYGCSSLVTVTIQNSTSKLAYSYNTFKGIASNAKLYVPSNLLSQYQSDSSWTDAFKGGIYAIQ